MVLPHRHCFDSNHTDELLEVRTVGLIEWNISSDEKIENCIFDVIFRNRTARIDFANALFLKSGILIVGRLTLMEALEGPQAF